MRRLHGRYAPPGLDSCVFLGLVCILQMGLTLDVAHAVTTSGPSFSVTPNCGIAGVTAVTIRGYKWKGFECCTRYRYRYFIGGSTTPVAVEPSNQDGYDPAVDGAWQPGERQPVSFTLPANLSPGDVKVRIQFETKLNSSSPWTCTQCRHRNYKIVTTIGNPWAQAFHTETSAETGLQTAHIRFDPRGVCDVPPCSKIKLVQVARLETDWTNGTLTCVPLFTRNRFLTPADFVPEYCNQIDYGPNAKDPFYGGDTGSSLEVGDPIDSDGDTPEIEGWLPEETNGKISYEVNIFCAAGEAQGKWLGRLFWVMTQTRGQKPQLSLDPNQAPPGREQPTADFLAAWNKGNSNPEHKYTSPVQRGPESGTSSCACYP